MPKKSAQKEQTRMRNKEGELPDAWQFPFLISYKFMSDLYFSDYLLFLKQLRYTYPVIFPQKK